MSPTKLAAVLAAVAMLAAPAFAGWFPGDPYKMHAPQLPDPFGWDVSFTSTPLGDDWLCTDTGPVNDIHLWLSFRGDVGPFPSTVVQGEVQIWSNVPADGVGYSQPGERLWGMFVDTRMPNVDLIPYGIGEQGWLDPLGETIAPPDHVRYYQLNIETVSETGIAPFTQREGEMYWLVAQLSAFDELLPVQMEIGWKTALQLDGTQYFDDAVYRPFIPLPWAELRDPSGDRSLDLAFVITAIPEPATMLLMILGVMGVRAYSRHTR